MDNIYDTTFSVYGIVYTALKRTLVHFDIGQLQGMYTTF